MRFTWTSSILWLSLSLSTFIPLLCQESGSLRELFRHKVQEIGLDGAEVWAVDLIHEHLEGVMVGIGLFDIAREIGDVEFSHAFTIRKLKNGELHPVLGHFHLGTLHQYRCAELGLVEKDHLKREALCQEAAFTHYTESVRYMEGVVNDPNRAEESLLVQQHFDYSGMLNDLSILAMSAAMDDSADAAAAERAETIFEHAINYFPEHSSILANYALFEFARRNFDKADALEIRAIQVSAGSDKEPMLLHNRGWHMLKAGNLVGAEEMWAAAVALPTFDGAQHMTRLDLAATRCTQGSRELSRVTYVQAISEVVQAAEQGNARAQTILAGGVFGALGTVLPQVITSVEDAVHDRHLLLTNLRMLREATSSPEALGRIVHKLLGLEGNSTLQMKQPLRLDDPGATVGCLALGYCLIYDGGDNLEPRVALAEFYKKASPSLGYTAPWLLESDPLARSRLKVGFLSSFWYRHSVGLLLESVVEGLPRQDFDVHLIALSSTYGPGGDIYMPGGTDGDEVSKRLSAAFPRGNIHAFPDSTRLAILQQYVAALELDVLVLGEIGMHSNTYFLAFSRLARRTVQFWGHASTSGISPVSLVLPDETEETEEKVAGTDPCTSGGVDYFISSSLFEDADAQLKYSERLIHTPGLSFAFRRPAMPEGLPVAPADVASGAWQIVRRAWLVSVSGSTGEKLLQNHELMHGPNWRLISVPQTLYKLHPDFDRLLAGVLTADPSALIVALRGVHEQAWVDRFVARVEHALPSSASGDAAKRIICLPNLKRDHYFRLVGYSDVVLDTFPVGGGRSSLEIFSTGTPIVVLYPRTSILQLTSGMYRAMGMFSRGQYDNTTHCAPVDTDYGLVTFNEGDYVHAAVTIAMNATYQAHIRSLIQERNSVLYVNNELQPPAAPPCACCLPNTVLADWTRVIKEVSVRPRPHCAALSDDKDVSLMPSALIL